jgi:4-hydroxybenzoate polyprenyltransferase
VAAIMGFYAAFLLSWAWVLHPLQSAKLWWLALAAAACQALWHVWLIRRREREGCFKAFRLNHWLGMTLFMGVVLSV